MYEPTGKYNEKLNILTAASPSPPDREFEALSDMVIDHDGI